MKTIQEISIVGQGLVGQTLLQYFSSKGLYIKQIVVKKPLGQPHPSVEYILDLELLKPVDLVLICVNDAALADVIDQIPEHQFTACTSGSINLEKFSNRPEIAVFYPLQSFTHLNTKAIAETPILIESQNRNASLQLEEFALRFFKSCRTMNSEQRAKLHLAAVFANNFTNHMMDLAQKICEQNNIHFDLLKPLILETTNKWMSHSAENLQTGPAVRGDQNVIEKHLSQLEGSLKNVYEVMTKSIQNSTKKKSL